MTVLSLVPCCGTYDCSKLAAGSVLTSPNAHIMERQKSVNEWIRGTAASSTNFFFFFMVFLKEISSSPNSNLHSLRLTKCDGALPGEADDKTKQTEEAAHVSMRMIRQQHYSEASALKQYESSSGRVNLQYSGLPLCSSVCSSMQSCMCALDFSFL